MILLLFFVLLLAHFLNMFFVFLDLGLGLNTVEFTLVSMVLGQSLDYTLYF